MTHTITSPTGKKLKIQKTHKTTPTMNSNPKLIAVREAHESRLAANKEYLKNSNVKAFLDAIAEAEGGDYDLEYGGIKNKKNDKWRITDYSTHPGPGFDGKTTAAGRYQINKANWRENGTKKMGLVDFSPETQDLIAVESLRQVHSIDDVIAGDIPVAIRKASATWASLPQGPGLSGRFNQPYMEYKKFVEVYKKSGGAFK